MEASAASSSQGWVLQGLGEGRGLEMLKWNPDLQFGPLGPTEVLVKFCATVLNFRDISIVNGTYPFPANDGVTPGSDGSGFVVEIGSRVTRFKPGDKVVTFLFQTGYFSNVPLTSLALENSVGGGVDGTLRTRGVFDQEGLCHMPSTLSFELGAALGGAYLTAWNILMGGVRQVKPGDCVLIQGSGNTSLAVLQLARLAGAIIIATTSSDEKAAQLRKLGATHVINYRRNAADWGKVARELSPKCVGCTHVVDVVGTPDSFRQSFEAVAAGGEVQIVGFLEAANVDDGDIGPTMFDTLTKNCAVRGIAGGSRHQFEELLNAVEATNFEPFVDRNTFTLSDLKKAYRYLEEQRHFGRVVVNHG